MHSLVIAEHDNKELHTATLCTLEAARQAGTEITLLIAGQGCSAVASTAAKIDGIKKVLCADDARYGHSLAENLAELVLSIAKNYSHIWAPATTFGKNFLPRVAALLDVAQISEITGVVSADTFVRPIYAGNAFATVQSSDSIKVISVRASAFARAGSGPNNAPIEALAAAQEYTQARFVSQEVTASERPELSGARVVISGGRGLQKGENFKLLEEIADKLGAAVGASRAAVDAGFVPNDYQVGQTGKIIAPDLYIAVGISGAIQHLAGMKDSKVIVAINKDPDAPIFQIADYGLVADLFQALPEFSSELDKQRAS